MFWNPKLALCLLLVSAVFTSCGLSDDLSGCPPTDPVDPPVQPETRTLKAVFVHEASDIDLSDEQFECATLYVFDMSGALVDTLELDTPVLFNEVFDTGLTLDPTEYEFVAWVNCVAPYSLADCTTRDNGQMTIDVPSDGYMTADLPWLLYGEKDYMVLETDEEQVVVIPFELNNYMVDLEVTGIAENDDEYEFEISGGSSSFDFDNEPNGTDFIYRVPAKFVNGVLTGNFNTIGFGKTGAAYFRIIDKTTHTVVWPTNPDDKENGNLTTIVEESGQDDGTTHGINIEIGLQPTEPTDPGEPTELRLTTVTVSGWDKDDDDYTVSPKR